MDEKASSTAVLDAKLRFVMYAQYHALLKHQVIVRRIILLENARSVTVITVNEKAHVLSLCRNCQDNLLYPPS